LLTDFGAEGTQIINSGADSGLHAECQDDHRLCGGRISAGNGMQREHRAGG
jgi:hypothetical protein